MGSNFSKHSRFKFNRHFKRKADGDFCKTSRSSTFRRNFELSFIANNVSRGNRDSWNMFHSTPLDIIGPMLLLEKLPSMSLQRWRSVWRASRWTLHGTFPRSYVCMKISRVPCRVTTFEKLPLLYHSINLDRSLYVIHCTFKSRR